MRVLIAEDDENMSKILKMYLQKEGYTVDVVSNGVEVIDYFETKSADLLLIDWMMPQKDGLETCKELRFMKVPVKIIMLTAKTSTDSEFRGLTTGADDYIKKPFDMKILLARIKKACNEENMLYFRDIELNPEAYKAVKNGLKLELTKKEFELLKFLMSNKNIILSREKILDHVWGIDYAGDLRTVDTHIRRLRKKIGDAYIQTSFGTGYIMGELHE